MTTGIDVPDFTAVHQSHLLARPLLAAGYTPLFDRSLLLEQIDPHPFEKLLVVE
ncbi:MAG: hypothetical protein WB777_13490 [Mycobacterium sp.]